jgi:hypothetical protein
LFPPHGVPAPLPHNGRLRRHLGMSQIRPFLRLAVLGLVQCDGVGSHM